MPTTAPESAGLCALGLVFIVSGSLNSAAGFSDLIRYKRYNAPSLLQAHVCSFDMVAVRGRPSGLPGLIPLGSLTCVQPPPLLV
ncbi:hypothetical protein EMIT0P294_140030 [Pseudomonas sp. IT-P294]